MNNSLVLLLTGVMVFCIGFLLFFNLAPMIWTPDTEKYIKYNDVRGMAVEYKEKLYTLNFDQQVEVIGYLNQSLPFKDAKISKKNKLEISKIRIYRFGQPDLILLPIEYKDNNLIFLSPDWNSEGFMRDISNGRLKSLLSQTYDS